MRYFSGLKFKDIRLKKKMTQQQLAENICSQALISKIENNDFTPSDVDIDKFAKRLNVEVEMFFIEDISETFNRIKCLVDNFIRHRDFDKANFLLEQNEELLCNYDKSYYIWRKGIITFEIGGQVKEALDMLHSIDVTHLSLKRYSLVLLSIASIYASSNDFENAFQYFSKIEKIKENLDIKEQIRFLYNYARSLYLAKKYVESLKYIEKAIVLLLEYDGLKILGHLYLLQANIFNENHMYTKALSSIKYAESAYFLQKDEESLMRCHLLRKELKENSNNEKNNKEHY